MMLLLFASDFGQLIPWWAYAIVDALIVLLVLAVIVFVIALSGKSHNDPKDKKREDPN
jgi:hypothetical protein